MAGDALQTAVRIAETTATSTPAARVFTDTDDHGLVQRRLGLVYGLLGVVTLGFWVLGVATVAAVMPHRFWELHTSAPKIGHMVVSAALIGMWLLCRGRLRPRWLLSSIDLVGSFKVTTVTSAMIALAPAGFRLELVGVTLFVLLMCLRAALVPSPPRWTLLVTSVAAIPLPFGVWQATVRDPTFDERLFPRSTLTIVSIGWALAAVFAAWAISRVVYGLRAEVKSAARLGQYTLEDKIGEGGMGVVYRARHALLRRPTAIKLLSPDRTAETHARRFEREVQITASLTHPNTVAVYDFGHTREGVFYYAMELLEGVTLQELVAAGGPQPAARVIHILSQAAGALAEAHAAGLVHRDIKPANIFLCERGGVPDFVKVLDFGLVKEQGRSDPMLSRTDAIAGTPLYMAPESITRPQEVDARVDLYALGGVGYWLVTGSPPFSGANLVEICSHHLHTTPDAPSARLGAPVPERLDALLLACLEKEPANRPTTAETLLRELRALQREHPWSAEDARGLVSTGRSPESAKAHAQRGPVQPVPARHETR